MKACEYKITNYNLQSCLISNSNFHKIEEDFKSMMINLTQLSPLKKLEKVIINIIYFIFIIYY